MQTVIHPDPSSWKQLLRRPALDLTELADPVGQILSEVRQRGDAALLDLTAKFDRVRLAQLAVSPEEMDLAADQLDAPLRQAIQTAKANIEAFHAAQRTEPQVIETMPGVRCWRKQVGIEKVGLYIPGGTAPLFSTVLMLAVPAKLAGCRERVLCTPPRKDGSVHPAILYAAQLSGVDRIFRIGGAQAIGAMAYGTASVPAVYKIFGPGNAYVTVAKQLVAQAGVAIDMPAGPSEVLVYADAGAAPAYVAADLLSQAEHGADSQVVLVTTEQGLAKRVLAEVDRQLAALPRRELAAQSMANSVAVVVRNETEALAVINTYGPEHLILACDEPQRLAEGVINAGSVFLGHYTPESVGDYASGTNHTLPTNGHARAYSGVSLDSFVRQITFQELTAEGLQALGPAVEAMARAEELEGHARAVSLRLAKTIR